MRTHGPERQAHVFACFCTKPARPGIFIPGLASIVMPPLQSALKGCLAHGYSIAGSQENFKL